MKLTNIAILALRGHLGIKQQLADALGVTPKTIYEYIRTNDDNLTKHAALEIIQSELNLPLSEILDKSKTQEEVNQ